jgi:precorrin-6Y C5,15-methyltransferase (decarboxylating)
VANAQETKNIRVVGIGDDGLEGVTAAVRKTIEEAELLIGAERTLDLIPDTGAERMIAGADLDEIVRRLERGKDKRACVLASGDPLFYGLARYLSDKLGKERFLVVPHVSTMQLAFARVMESWEEAYLTNLANHKLETVVEKIRVADKAGLFTTDAATPNRVARTLLDAGVDYFTAYVCENLGSPDERVTHGELDEIARLSFGSLNVMILVRKPDAPDRPSEKAGFRTFGNPEEAFLQSKPKQGLLTPAEVRSQALAEMDLGPTSIVWDVGAGSGSVSIEAAQLARDGTTYAIEMDAEDHQLIIENAKRFGVSNVEAVLGRAPEVWADLPDPHAVFVQGSGREISRLIDLAHQRLRPGGRLVAVVGSIDNLADVHRAMSRLAANTKVWMLNIARGTHQLERLRFDALNPTFLLSLVKDAAK